MPKATSTFTTPAAEPQPPLISGHAAISIADTIGRLKQIAGEAMDRLYLSDGPPQPDHVLLDATADVLRLMCESAWNKDPI